MMHELIELSVMPTALDFFDTYWNQRPFVVKAGIAEDSIDELITPNELASLAMEEDAISRLVKSPDGDQGWTCRYGPFDEKDLSEMGNQGWNLLVGNVEQFHPDTAKLLNFFNFAPRWMMDDVMVSYSSMGGTVGPHMDSYHVFLVQGEGKRRWKVSHHTIGCEDYIENIDLKVMKTDFAGDEVEMNVGDVLYIPPNFAHHGITLEPALTYSVGFLGPKSSELFSAFGDYLACNEDLDERYVGGQLTQQDQGFHMGSSAVNSVGDFLSKTQGSTTFTRWLVEFFTDPTHQEFAQFIVRDDAFDLTTLKIKLQTGYALVKPEYVKLAVVDGGNGKIYIGFEHHSFVIDVGSMTVLHAIMNGQTVSAAEFPELFKNQKLLGTIVELYNHSALEFF